MKMKQHITAVGALHIGLGVLGILVAIIVLVSTIGPGLIALSVEGDALALSILTVIGCGAGGFLVILSIPGIIGGIGLLRLQPWARYLVLILAVLDLFNIPIGTAIGLYTFWVLIQDETEQLFIAGSGE
jgi:hypothetical protein